MSAFDASEEKRSLQPMALLVGSSIQLNPWLPFASLKPGRNGVNELQFSASMI